MKRMLSSYKLAWILTSIAAVGLSLSMLLTRDLRWTQWHLSRLGEGSGFPAAIFNFSLGAAAVVLTLLATRLTYEIQRTEPHKGTGYVRAILVAVAICWVGLAAFSSDYFLMIHDVCGYGQFLLIVTLMISLRKRCPRFSIRTYNLGLMAALTSSILLAMYHITHFASLTVVELVGEALLFVWLISLTADHRR